MAHVRLLCLWFFDRDVPWPKDPGVGGVGHEPSRDNKQKASTKET